jgi:uncharacterized caspase-like protein
MLMTILFPSAGSAAGEGKRVALIIGNGNYALAPALPNPARDARLMSETLQAAGFQILEGIDLDYNAMRDLLNRFTEVAYDSDVVLIYYAGHGMQVNGKNFLVPVDAELTSPAHLRTRTIDIDQMLAALPPDPAIGILILDACRDNPLSRSLAAASPRTRSTVGSGLAPIDVSAAGIGSGGLLIAYATDPGAVAYDGGGENSPYTSALVKHLATPGLEIQSALTRVRGEVTAATDGRQRPWHNASLGREVFIGAAPEILVVGEAAQEGGAQAGGESGDWEIEQRIWEEASKRNTVAHYEAYLRRFPKGNFADLAKINIGQLNGAPEARKLAALAPESKDGTSASGPAEPAPLAAGETGVGTVAEMAERALALDKAARMDLQTRLLALGYDVGSSDGSFGLRTRRAIGTWQATNDHRPTTFLDERQRLQLIEASEPLMDAFRVEQRSARPPREPVAAGPRERAGANNKQVRADRAPRDEQTPRYKECTNGRSHFFVPATERCPISGSGH